MDKHDQKLKQDPPQDQPAPPLAEQSQIASLLGTSQQQNSQPPADQKDLLPEGQQIPLAAPEPQNILQEEQKAEQKLLDNSHDNKEPIPEHNPPKKKSINELEETPSEFLAKKLSQKEKSKKKSSLKPETHYEMIQLKYQARVVQPELERQSRILKSLKKKYEPIDHRQLFEHSQKIRSEQVRDSQIRQEKMASKLNDLRQLNQSYKPKKSKTYQRVKSELGKKTMERSKRIKRFQETREKYSQKVKEIINMRQKITQDPKSFSQPNLYYSNREMQRRAEEQKKQDYHKSRKRYEIGNSYLDEIRARNAVMSERDRNRNKLVPQIDWERKIRAYEERNNKIDYLKEISETQREKRGKLSHKKKFGLGAEGRKDLLKMIYPVESSDQKRMVSTVVKNIDSGLKRKEVANKFDRKNYGKLAKTALELDFEYINSIEIKLALLEKNLQKGEMQGMLPDKWGKKKREEQTEEEEESEEQEETED